MLKAICVLVFIGALELELELKPELELDVKPQDFRIPPILQEQLESSIIAILPTLPHIMSDKMSYSFRVHRAHLT